MVRRNSSSDSPLALISFHSQSFSQALPGTRKQVVEKHAPTLRLKKLAVSTGKICVGSQFEFRTFCTGLEEERSAGDMVGGLLPPVRSALDEACPSETIVEAAHDERHHLRQGSSH